MQNLPLILLSLMPMIIDTAVNSLNNILLDSAKNAGFYKKRLENQDTGANNVTGKFKQPWFNQKNFVISYVKNFVMPKITIFIEKPQVTK